MKILLGRLLATRGIKRATVSRWLDMGFWAIVDQGLFAISNFGLNVLLARWLAPADYGAFAVAYSLLLLLGTFHTALITEPMLVFGPGKYKNRFTGYLKVLLWGHWSFTALMATLFAFAGLVVWLFGSPLTTVIFALAITCPFILFPWLMRRACYVNLQPQLAAHAGALYMALMFAGTYGFYHFSWLGPATALGVIALAGLLSGLWLRFRLNDDKASQGMRNLVAETQAHHWQYARWMIGAGVLGWIPGNIYYLLLAPVLGLEASGALRALSNLVLPVTHITGALATLLLPRLVRFRSDYQQFVKLFALTLLALTTITLSYWLFLMFGGPSLMGAVYGEQYADYAHLLLIAGLVPVLSAIVAVLSSAVKSFEAPRFVFLSHLGAAITTITIGLLAVVTFGVAGALIGNLISLCIVVTMLGFFLRQLL